MALIRGSVGERGLNKGEDVRLVEFLLNRSMQRIYPPSTRMQPDGSMAVIALKADHTVTPGTIKTIRDFQKNVLRFHSPDGRVDPNGRTIKALFRIFQSEGGVTVLNQRLANIRIASGGKTHIVGGSSLTSGRYSRGDIFWGFDGQRLILSVTARETVFLLLDGSGPGHEDRDMNPMRGHVGSIYAQRTSAFIDEAHGMFYHKLAKNLEPIKTLIEAEIEIVLGIIAASSGVGLVLVVGGKTLHFIYENKDDIPKYERIFDAVLDTRRSLKPIAPTLYDKLLYSLFISYVNHILPLVPQKTKLQTAAYTAGVLIGAIGKQMLEKKLRVFSIILTIVVRIVSIIVKATPTALQEATQEWDKNGDAIAQNLRSIGANISPEEQAAIFKEISSHPNEIKAIIDNLIKVLNENSY